MLETLFNLCNEFFGIERLGNVVIAFQVEPFQAVGLFRSVCEKEDQHVSVLLTYHLRQLKTVHQRHVDVQQHHVGLGGRECLPTFASILGILHFIAFHLQELP